MHALWLAALLVVAPLSAAHPGNDGGLKAGVLQGEGYDGPQPECDPTRDGEHTRVADDAAASGDQVVLLPGSSCEIRYADVTFPGWGRFEQVRIGVSGADRTVGLSVRIRVDGTRVAEASLDQDPGDPLQTHPVDFNASLGPGTHPVVVEYRATEGPGWANLHVDLVEGTFQGDDPPNRCRRLLAWQRCAEIDRRRHDLRQRCEEVLARRLCRQVLG